MRLRGPWCAAAAALVAAALAACGSAPGPGDAVERSGAVHGAAVGVRPGEAPASAPAPATPPASSPAAVTLTLAFAGDVHFDGVSASALTRGLGSGAAPLAAADLAVVNLETAITDAGQAAPSKQYLFRAPARAFDALKAAGVDAVSVANNHGMDYGVSGLRDTLTAARERGMPVIGAGEDSAHAWEPLRRTVHGVRVSVIAATDVLDEHLRRSWTAGPHQPGLASAKDGRAFANAIARERPHADLVVAFVHWGVEQQVCPTARQRELARQLVAAGADIIVGSHAHVVQPMQTLDGAVVAYGMGNFVFYAPADPATRSGVFTVTATAVPGAGPAGHRTVAGRWTPARIVGGRPMAVPAGAAAGLQLPPLAACSIP